MGRTSTRRWSRLWAARRWRLVEQQLSDLSMEPGRLSKLPVAFPLPVCCARNQVRQERLQGSIPPAAAHLQQCHDLRGRQSQAAHRLCSSERSALTFFAKVWRVFFCLSNTLSCRDLSQLAQRRPVCPARAQWRQQTEGETGSLFFAWICRPDREEFMVCWSTRRATWFCRATTSSRRWPRSPSVPTKSTTSTSTRAGEEPRQQRLTSVPTALWPCWSSSTASSLQWVRGKKGSSTSRQDRSSSWPRRKTDTCRWWGNRILLFLL